MGGKNTDWHQQIRDDHERQHAAILEAYNRLIRANETQADALHLMADKVGALNPNAIRR